MLIHQIITHLARITEVTSASMSKITLSISWVNPWSSCCYREMGIEFCSEIRIQNNHQVLLRNKNTVLAQTLTCTRTALSLSLSLFHSMKHTHTEEAMTEEEDEQHAMKQRDARKFLVTAHQWTTTHFYSPHINHTLITCLNSTHAQQHTSHVFAALTGHHSHDLATN